ncbi:hypothetical protein ANANG_G00185450 [Anguilla anguilla]|uniref:Uncharacterized protein n=1 Tax=Anguilla anguilla TaxID=7936 RepID=A0A9D3M621_ANGAN|nr:hypothetical protein ANANG_G00185450 [Anguilla anguilla]
MSMQRERGGGARGIFLPKMWTSLGKLQIPRLPVGALKSKVRNSSPEHAALPLANHRREHQRRRRSGLAYLTPCRNSPPAPLPRAPPQRALTRAPESCKAAAQLSSRRVFAGFSHEDFVIHPPVDLPRCAIQSGLSPAFLIEIQRRLTASANF